jgi:hypothetical protein
LSQRLPHGIITNMFRQDLEFKFMKSLFFIIAVFFAQQLAFAECVREVANPSNTVLDVTKHFRVIFKKSFQIAKSDDNWRTYDSKAYFQDGKILEAKRVEDYRGFTLEEPKADPARPFCRIKFKSGNFTEGQLSKNLFHCLKLSDEGKFCDDVFEKYKTTVNIGDSVDLDHDNIYSASGCAINGKAIDNIEQAFFRDQFKLNLWSHKGGGREEYTDAPPEWENSIYEVYCAVPHKFECVENNVTVQTLLDAFPAGSITVYHVDKSVESCESSAQ